MRSHSYGVSLVLLLLTLIFSMTVGAATAAPLRPAKYDCYPMEFPQHDMSGIYEMSAMMVVIHPCGTVGIAWINNYGEHIAGYYSYERIPGGGVRAYGYMPDRDINAYLDNTPEIIVKPAESRWIQVATIDDNDLIHRVYRLRKTS